MDTCIHRGWSHVNLLIRINLPCWITAIRHMCKLIYDIPLGNEGNLINVLRMFGETLLFFLYFKAELGGSKSRTFHCKYKIMCPHMSGAVKSLKPALTFESAILHGCINARTFYYPQISFQPSHYGFLEALQKMRSNSWNATGGHLMLGMINCIIKGF